MSERGDVILENPRKTVFRFVGVLFLLVAAYVSYGGFTFSRAWADAPASEIAAAECSADFMKVFDYEFQSDRLPSDASRLTLSRLRERAPLLGNWKNHFVGGAVTSYVWLFESKSRLQEMLLNHSYFGKGEAGPLMGVKSGAAFYLKKNCSELTLEDSALLVVIGRAPGILGQDQAREKAIKVRDLLLVKMAEDHIIETK